jgi:hypothetical protein
MALGSISSFLSSGSNLLSNLGLSGGAGGGRQIAAGSGLARRAQGGDLLELSGAAGPSKAQAGLTVNGSGVYSLQASSLSLSAQRLNVSLGSRGQASGRSAMGALNGALGATGTADSGPMLRLRQALGRLGVSDKNVRDLMMVASMLGKLDPEALEKMVSGIERMAGGSAAEAPVAAPDAGGAAAAQAAAPSPAGGSRFSLNYVSVSIAITEIEASTVTTEGGEVTQVSARRFELRFERLEISMSQQQQQAEGDPIVLDIDGDGMNLRPTSDGVLFDLTGSGEAVRTAFVQGDDALLFYDANLNGLLDGGGELVGNRVPGLDGMQELTALDENGDGRITAADTAWRYLRLFQDLDGNGQASAGEVRLLEELGIAELSTLWQRDEGSDGEGLRRAGASTFTRDDGTQGLMLDYWFGYQPA